MSIREWIHLFWQQVVATSALEWMAVIFGVAEVFLAQANKILLYPAGIIASSITVYVLFNAGLYAESVLSLYYVVMSFYGWWHWIKKRHLPPVKISWCTKQEWLYVIGIVAVSFLLMVFALKNYTPSTVPYLDAWISATAWAGMWLLARRKVENWILLNISNAFAVPLLFYKQLPMFAVLTIILFVVAIFGFFKWKKTAGGENGDTNFVQAVNQ